MSDDIWELIIAILRKLYKLEKLKFTQNEKKKSLIVIFFVTCNY